MTREGDPAGLPGGLWPVMLTPFRENGRVDEAALERLVEFYLHAGAAGLFANCLSSEMYHLSEEERLSIVRTTVVAARSRVPVIATGTFSGTPAADAEFIARLHDCGVAAAVVVTSMMAAPDESDERLMRNVEELMGLTGEIPLGLYECPLPYKRLLTPSMLASLAGSGRFVYHKDTSCDHEAILEKVAAVAGTPLGFYNANTPTAISSLDEGARGLSPISANFYPELFTRLLELHQEDPAGEELSSLGALLSVMDSVTHAFYPYSAKVFLSRRGLPIPTFCRVPVPEMAREDALKLEALLRVAEDRVTAFGGRATARG